MFLDIHWAMYYLFTGAFHPRPDLIFPKVSTTRALRVTTLGPSVATNSVDAKMLEILHNIIFMNNYILFPSIASKLNARVFCTLAVFQISGTILSFNFPRNDNNIFWNFVHAFECTINSNSKFCWKWF